MAQEYSLGLVEVSGLGHAIIMLDDMLKAGDVEFVATERKLGGRLVTIVVRGEIAAVKAAVDAGVARAKACGDKIYKASQVIARPHPEIFPYLHLNEDEENTPEVNTQSAATHVGSVGTGSSGRTGSSGSKAKAVKAEATAAKPKTTTTRKRNTAGTSKTAAKKPAAKKTTTKSTTGSSGGKKKAAEKKN